uniref:Uncharacterized protein n=1 Tax=Onchocerca volvulus TaxID=6282 RepID=A0A8R1TYZ7_ONCVO
MKEKEKENNFYSFIVCLANDSNDRGRNLIGAGIDENLMMKISIHYLIQFLRFPRGMRNEAQTFDKY